MRGTAASLESIYIRGRKKNYEQRAIERAQKNQKTASLFREYETERGTEKERETKGNESTKQSERI